MIQRDYQSPLFCTTPIFRLKPFGHPETAMHKTITEVTNRIIECSKATRSAYLARIAEARDEGPQRGHMSCGNLAHGFAAAPDDDKQRLRASKRANIAIISSYNDMLSAHQPFEAYPKLIKQAVRLKGATAQFAGGVPAMCDGVTQGAAGMELSLFSRDVIAMSTAIALSHNMFDGALMLGICDKIVPGMLMGALAFGHLPIIFVPGGPMPSGLANKEKARVRQAYAEGKASREDLLNAEAASYHSPGTCTFYGTANSNQMLMEVMGLHMPGAAFVNPGTPLRDALTKAAAEQVCDITALEDDYRPVGQVVDEKAIVNAIAGLAATGGSTNHTIHIVAIAKAAGILVNWTDFDEISQVVPLVTRIYPNGTADVNHFQAAGGMGFVIRDLLEHGLLHPDIKTVSGKDLYHQAQEPVLSPEHRLVWQDAPSASLDTNIVRSATEPFDTEGGIRLLTGNLGRAVVKISAVAHAHRAITAPAIIFESQEALLSAFKKNELECDFIAVVRHQGPRANGMPELHKLTPTLGVLQDRGFKVALLTDGRMSGASGKVLAAIHVTPEALANGPIAVLRTGDMITIDGHAGTFSVANDLSNRVCEGVDLAAHHHGVGRELFASMRSSVSLAEEGATSVYGAS